MNRYAIIVGTPPKCIENTDVPDDVADHLAWLAQYRFAGAWVLVSPDAVPGAIYNGNGSSTNPSAPVVSAPNKTFGLSLDEFRKLFTDAEQEVIDSYDMAGCTVVLTDAQKIKMRNFVKKAEARGAVLAIDMTTNGMSAGLDFLTARGFIAAGRKAEIVAGVVKS